MKGKQGFKWWTLPLVLASVSVLPIPTHAQNASTPKEQKSDGSVMVKGVVKDEQGETLPGVAIQIKGSTRGVITDIDGRFEFPGLKPGDVLTVQLVGMQTQDVTYNGEKTLEITLHEKADELEEVTVVAFAKQKKESVVSSIATLNPKELKVPSSNLTTALAGRVGGLISYQTSGEPGKDNASFFIRGVTTFSEGKRDPLILIDGIELDANALANLSPDDIASFSVLKDASATSLYGARGANGVIMVTTKKGREGKITINARVEASVSKPTEMMDLADPVTYMRMQNEAIKTRDPMATYRYSEEKIRMTEEGRFPSLFPALNWYDIMLKDKTWNQRGNVSLSGGGKAVRYYVSANFNHDAGNIRVDKRNDYNSNIEMKKYAFRSNINIDLTPTTEFYLKLYTQFEDYSGPIQGGAEAYRSSVQANPVLFLPYYEPDKQYTGMQHILYGNYGEGNYVNPYAIIQKGYKEYDRNQTVAQVGFDQKLDMLTKGLSLRGMLNLDRYSSYEFERSWEPYYYGLSSYDLSDGSYTLKRLKSGGDGLGFQDNGQWITNTVYLEATAEYARKFNETHGVNALLVYTMRDKKYADKYHSTLEQSLPFRNMGLAGRLAYNYDDRYMVEANFGYNGSERFAKNHRWGFFPSIGGGWMISNEKFWKPLSSIIDKLKLRATYGMAGNDQIGSDQDRFYYISSVNNGANAGVNWGDNMGYNPGNGFKVNRYANDRIGWETSYKLNTGIEFGTPWGLSGYVEYFHERRENILLNRMVPATTGLYQDFKANLGKAKGYGVDMEVNYEKSFNKDLWLTARSTFTFARNRVVEWEEPDYSATPWKAHNGKSIQTIWGYVAERLFIDDEEIKNSPEQPWGEVKAGDIKYRDINGDGKISELDQVPIGFPSTPEINYGFGFSMGYKNFDVSCFFTGAARSSFQLELAAITPFHNIRSDGLIGENAVLQTIADNRWTEANPNPYAFWPRLDVGLNQNNSQSSTWWIQDGSYLRLKSVEIGYSLPEKWMRRIGLTSFRVYFSGSNLACWSKFKLWDPELGGNGLNYPLQKVFNVGVNLSL